MGPGARRRHLDAPGERISRDFRGGGDPCDDVQRLTRAGHLKADVLRERYYTELRPNLLAAARGQVAYTRKVFRLPPDSAATAGCRGKKGLSKDPL